MSEQLELHPEGTGAGAPPISQRHPRQAAITPAVPGESLTYPTNRETAEFAADNWHRHGLDVEVVRRGRDWVMVER